MIRLIWTLASLRAGGMRIRWRDALAARRALAGPAPYDALRAALHPRARELEVFDSVVLAALGVARVLPSPRSRSRG